MIKRITAFIIAFVMSFTAVCYAREVGVVKSYYLLKYEYGSFVSPLITNGVTEEELLVFFDDVEKEMQKIDNLNKQNFETNLKQVLLNVATFRENRKVSSAVMDCYGDEISSYMDTGVMPKAFEDVFNAVVRAIFGENEVDKLELVTAYEKYKSIVESGLGGYTKESAQKFSDSMKAALSVLKNKTATQSEIDESLSEINKCYDGLEKVSQSGNGSCGTGKNDSSNGNAGNKDLPNVIPDTNKDSGKPIVFLDVKNDYWGYEAIMKLSEMGIINGYADNTFLPEKLITREEFAKLLCIALKLDVTETSATYADVSKGAWYEQYVNAITASKLMQGTDDNKFGIGRTLTRQDMAVIAARAIEEKLISYEQKELNDDIESFADIEKASQYARESISIMKKYGIINGVGNNEFAPLEGVTRAQAAKIIYGLAK